MEIIDNRKEEQVGNILQGEVFTVNREYYMRTSRDAYIINLKNGELIYVEDWLEDYATFATVVNATLTVE